jgi:hypothetical protein
MLTAMKQFRKLFTKFLIKEQTKPLGRWYIDYSTNKMNRKIDLANEDHCGPCGQYAIKNNVNTAVTNKSIKL